MVLTRSKRKLADLQPTSPQVESTDDTIFADNFSPAKITTMSGPIVGDSSCNWHASHEEAFILFLEEEFDTGRMGMNNTLNIKQVNEISLKLKALTGRSYDATQIKAKFARMKAKTNAFHKLINTTGFGWGSKTNTVTADETVWTTYLKANPTATVFKKKGLLGFEKLFKIFKNLTATGVFGRASTQGPLNSDDEQQMGGSPIMLPMDNAYNLRSGGKSRSGKRSMTSLDALLEIMSETSRAKKAHYATKATSAEEYSMTDCMVVLSNLPISGEQYALAAEKLISGKDWRTFFLLSSPDRQLEWLFGLK